MLAGFNVLLTGLGSKFHLLEEFRRGGAAGRALRDGDGVQVELLAGGAGGDALWEGLRSEH